MHTRSWYAHVRDDQVIVGPLPLLLLVNQRLTVSFLSYHLLSHFAIYVLLRLFRRHSSNLLICPFSSIQHPRFHHRIHRYDNTTKMRGFLVKFVGFALYVHDLQSGTLTLTHQRPNRKPAEYVLNEEDFEDSAGELDDETVATLEPGIEASAVGLSLRLIKNDGVLKATFESEHHGVADWTFHGLRGSNAGRMTACAFTQTAPETSAGCMCTGILPPELSNSTIQIVSTNPIPERIIQPPASGLSIISTTETRPLKRKATEDMDQPKPHKRAKSSHDSVPWPNHLYMTCLRTKPIHKSDIGTLHIDLIEGTVWFEGWYGKPNARTYEKKQIDLCDPSSKLSECKEQYLLLTPQPYIPQRLTHVIS